MIEVSDNVKKIVQFWVKLPKSKHKFEKLHKCQDVIGD